MTPDYEAIGYAAYESGSRSPMSDPQIQNAVKDLPVGGGAAEIFRAYAHGYDRAATNAANAILT